MSVHAHSEGRDEVEKRSGARSRGMEADEEAKNHHEKKAEDIGGCSSKSKTAAISERTPFSNLYNCIRANLPPLQGSPKEACWRSHAVRELLHACLPNKKKQTCSHSCPCRMLRRNSSGSPRRVDMTI